jgi:predicted NBD/HSP70 family sugar kinase
MSAVHVPSPREKTRALVLDLIREAQSVSRVELADASGLAAATITNVVRGLIAEGVVHEAGRARSRGGTPRRLLELNAGSRFAVGVQIDWHTATIVILDLAGEVVARTSFAGSGPRGPQESLTELAGRIEAMLCSSGVPQDTVVGVGLATHGPQDRHSGVLLASNPSPGWKGFPIVTAFEEMLSLPVVLENDATAAVIGERGRLSNGQRTIGLVYMGSGIGGGVFVNGDAYRGASSNGTEIGHISLDINGELCGCGNRGCLEMLAGPHQVVKGAFAMPDLTERLGLVGGHDAIVKDFARLTRAAAEGDPVPRALVDASARYIGSAVVSLTNLFDLDEVVLAGTGFDHAGQIYLEAVSHALSSTSYARAHRTVHARLSSSPVFAVAIGAATMMLRRRVPSAEHS